MDAFDLLKWKKKKRKAHKSPPVDADHDSAIIEEPANTNVSNGHGTDIPNEDMPSLGNEKEPMFHVARKRLFASPISLVLIAAVIVAGVGLWLFTSFKSGLKFTIKKGSPPIASKAQGGVGGIQFGEKKAEHGDIVTRCEGKEGEEKNKCLAEGMVNTPRADADKEAQTSPVSPATPVDGPSLAPTETKIVTGDKTTPAGPSAIKGPSDEVRTVQPAANPPVPPAQKNSPPQAVASTPGAVDGKSPATSPTSSSSLPPASAPQVVTPPARDKTLPVPIELALKDTAPFRERFERKYAEKLKEKKNKEAETLKAQQGTAGRLPGVSPTNIKDLMGADGKPLAPNVMPGAVLDGMGVPVAATTLYGVMIAGDRKTAVTSKGEVSVGGKIDGDVVVDITAEGVKFKSGRIMQISSK